MKTIECVNSPVTITVTILIAWLIFEYQNSSLIKDNLLTQEQIDSYKKHGILLVKEPIFSPKKLDEITQTLINRVKLLPPGAKTEFSTEMNSAHLKDEEILKIAQEPVVVEMAAQLLDTKDVNIFTTRILCKMPEVWYESHYFWIS